MELCDRSKKRTALHRSTQNSGIFRPQAPIHAWIMKLAKASFTVRVKPFEKWFKIHCARTVP